MRFREARRALARTPLPMHGTLEELFERFAEDNGYKDRDVDLALDALAEAVAKKDEEE